MAVEHGAIVGFDFNDVRCEASPGESADAVVERWHSENERRAALPENIAKWAAMEARMEAERVAAQAKMDSLMARLRSEEILDPQSAIVWLCQMQPHADHVGVTYDRALVESTFLAAGYGRGVLCRLDNEETHQWAARVGWRGQALWLIGQALDGIATMGAPHQVIHSFAEKMGIH